MVHFSRTRLRPILNDDQVDEEHLWTTSSPPQVQPAAHCEGTGYGALHAKPIPQRSIVEAYAGRLVFLPLVAGISTSELIRRIRALGQERAER